MRLLKAFCYVIHLITGDVVEGKIMFPYSEDNALYKIILT